MPQLRVGQEDFAARAMRNHQHPDFPSQVELRPSGCKEQPYPIWHGPARRRQAGVPHGRQDEVSANSSLTLGMTGESIDETEGNTMMVLILSFLNSYVVCSGF